MNRAAGQTGRIALRAPFPGFSSGGMEQAWTQPVVTGGEAGRWRHGPESASENTLGSERNFAYRFSMTFQEIPQIQQLTKEEKLQLVGDLWDAIAALPDDLPVSDEEKALLDKRWKAHSESPQDALTLEDFKKRLAERL